MELTKTSHPVAETTAPASKPSGADGGAELLPGEALQEELVQVESSDADAAAEASSRVVVVDLLVIMQVNCAACYLKLEDHRAAIAACTAALHHLPRHPKALYRRGVAYSAVNLLDEAEADLQA